MRGYDDPFWHAGQSSRRDPGAVPPSQMRVSDAERHEIAEALSKHFAEGRLDQVELDERLTRAMGAKTRADLSGLLSDLPPIPGSAAPPPPAMRRHGRGRVVLIGLAAFVLLSSWTWHNSFGRGWFFVPHFGSLIFIALIAFLVTRRRSWASRMGSRFGRGPIRF